MLKIDDGYTWRFDANREPIPCLMICVDRRFGEHVEIKNPTQFQVSQTLKLGRQINLLFLVEDANRKHITGVRIGSIAVDAGGWNPILELSRAHISFQV